MTVTCGIAGWVDKSLIDSKLFYPLSVKTSGDRLHFYASQFSLVEVDSTYYGMPKPENSDLWVARTEPGFLFDVKSFSLFTNHPTKPMALPRTSASSCRTSSARKTSTSSRCPTS